jgi:TP901-1 family phage major tail protein
MPAQRGKDLLLKVDDGATGLVTIGGLRARQIAFNAQTVDVTHADSAGRWRELLAGAGVRRATISGAGIFRDEASDLRLRAVFFAGEIRQWQVVIPDFGAVSGPFQITSLEYRGEHDGEVTFDLALESAGLLTFTPVP